MLGKILVPKNEKDKMRLKAARQTLRGMRQEYKNYKLHGIWELDNILVSKDYLTGRFGSIEEAAKCLSDEIGITPITREERELLKQKLDFSIRKVCIEDIKYTMHEKYANNLGVSITRAQRLSQILKLEKQNPDYYSKQLKDYNFVKKDMDAIQIYFKEDKDGKSYGTIVEGNNRILKMKCDMASELAHTSNPEEVKRIKDKYTIYVQAKDVKDLDLVKRR